MHDNLMADSDPESEIQSDTLSLRNLSSSLFNIPGFFVGFGTKGSLDFDSLRSPTSPLDIGVFSNLRNTVSRRHALSSSKNGFQKEWHCSKIGLGIVHSLVDDTTSVLDIPKQNIIFGSQIKTNTTNSFKRHLCSLDSSLKSKSLPTNYIASRLSQTKRLHSLLNSKKVVLGDKEVLLESEPFQNTPLCFSDSTMPSSLVSLSYNHNSRSENLCSEVKTRMSSPPLVIGTSSEVEDSLGIKLSTVPIPIGPSHGYVGSLSKREIELSEDYTCIISHGPNPKTIHIFGDCVLECHANEMENFGKKEEWGIESPQVATNSKDLAPVQPDEALRFCYSCKTKLEEDKDIYMYRGEKVFCSFDCFSNEISDEETEKTDQHSAGTSPEDLFLYGMPVA